MPKLSANLSLLFRELPLLERFAAARAAGFAAAEVQIPYDFPAATVAAAARAAGLPVILINAPMGKDPRELGLAGRRDRRADFRAGLTRAAEYAAALSCPRVNVLAGRVPVIERQAALELYAENLVLAAEALAPAGARPLLEVLNPVDATDYCVPDFDLAWQVLEHCDGAAGLQFDLYHAAMLGLDPAREFSRRLARIEHVQFADSPGRHEPGTGTLDFPGIFAAVDASGYTGWVGAEYHPLTTTPEGLGWLTAVKNHAF